MINSHYKITNKTKFYFLFSTPYCVLKRAAYVGFIWNVRILCDNGKRTQMIMTRVYCNCTKNSVKYAN